MKKIEELLKLDMHAKFDTPKKLNRSALEIPARIIDALEAGEFTAESIAELAGTYPIFRYRSCITVHGRWPAVSIERIGNYKNVHQNACGSVEIFYSAIDRAKIEQIRAGIRGVQTNFRYSESSAGRVFQMAEPVTRETLAELRAKFEPIAQRLASLNIYGHINLYIGQSLWQNFLCLDVVPLAIPADQVQTIILELCGMDAATWTAARAASDAEQQADEQRRQAEREAYARERLEQKNALLAKYEAEYKPKIAHLPECTDITRGVLVKVFTTVTNELQFAYYRMDGRGSFGRVNWSKAISAEFVPDLSGLEFKPQKQKPLTEFKLQNFRLLQPLKKAA